VKKSSSVLLSLSLLILIAIFQPYLFAFQAAQPIIGTVAGGGPNYLPATVSPLNNPSAVVADSQGNYYVAASGANRVYKVDTTGTLTVFAGNGEDWPRGDGGPAVNAELSGPQGLAVDAYDNVYIADTYNNLVRVVCTSINGPFCSTGQTPSQPQRGSFLCLCDIYADGRGGADNHLQCAAGCDLRSYADHAGCDGQFGIGGQLWG
jgi:hypothetical protein